MSGDPVAEALQAENKRLRTALEWIRDFSELKSDAFNKKWEQVPIQLEGIGSLWLGGQRAAVASRVLRSRTWAPTKRRCTLTSRVLRSRTWAPTKRRCTRRT